jgi:transcriptional regulator with XRE-family HTH domain
MAAENADLGRALRRLRRTRRKTIEEVAFDAGVHPTYLSGIERGIRNPTFDKLSGLADALDISLGSIFTEAETETRYRLHKEAFDI